MKNILILHGAIGSSDQLLPLSNLLENKFKVYLLNFSGHGGKAFETQFNIPQFAQDVLVFLDENNIDKTDVFGYSMGGYVALYLAKHYPNKIGKVITLGTKFKWNTDIALKENKMLNADKILEKIPSFAKILEQRHLPNDWTLVLDKTASMMLEMGIDNPLNTKDYCTIKHQVKIGLADNDEMVTDEETQEIVRLLNAQYYSLVNSNHPIEKVDLIGLASEISSFID